MGLKKKIEAGRVGKIDERNEVGSGKQTSEISKLEIRNRVAKWKPICELAYQFYGIKKLQDHLFFNAGTIAHYFIVDLDTTNVEIASLIKQHGYLVGTFASGSDIENYQAGDIYYGPQQEDVDTKSYRHCILVTGIGQEEETNANGEVVTTTYLEIRNSIGPNWGDKGFGLINKCLFINLYGVQGVEIHNPEDIPDPKAP
ncbi:hypothetical protein LIER_20169 [Lithospermum erythrorhizon]|uniref:Peptidase C1A papain C-terminal domain-containing protein n=1 Tax=Lithospermum erythrorhizon TaxID=34254 RepID=A0AAV3QKH9_LITER